MSPPPLPSRLLETLMDDTAPFFGVDGSQKIILWNLGMTKLTGYSSEEVHKKYCFDILQGKDTYGNSYCTRHCPIIQGLKRHEDIHPFEMFILKKESHHRFRIRCEYIMTTTWKDNSTICVYRVKALEDGPD